MSRRHLQFGSLLILIAVAAAGCNLPSAGPVSTPTVTPTASPTVTPTPSPTPTPAPEARLDQAEWALFVGDWGRAREAFQRARDQASEAETRGAAQLGIGTVHLRAGRFDEADTALTAFLQEYPDHPEAWQGYFLRGVARQETGRAEAAIGDFERYLEQRPQRIDAYVHENLGDLLRQVERPLEAIERYRAALEADRLGGGLSLQLKIGRAYAEAENYAQAVEQYDAVYQAAGDAATKATANLLAGRALEAVGDVQAAHQRYLESVDQFPRAYDSYIGLITLVEAGVPVDLYQRGLVDYFAGAYDPALRAFNRAEGAGNVTPALYYYRGLTLRALDESASAVLDFRFLIDNFPNSDLWAEAWFEKARTEWVYLEQHAAAVDTYLGFAAAAAEHPRAPEALLAAGRVAERMDDLARAEAIWLDLVDRYPDSALAHEAAFAAGIARYRQGKAEAARDAFETAERLTSDVRARSAALLWTGKAYRAQGQEEAAVETWRGAYDLDPTGYYAERARDLAEGRAPFESAGVPDFAVDREAARAEAEAWLRERFEVDGPEPLTELSPELLQDPRRVRGDEFWRLGLYTHARAEYETLRESVEGDAEATYRLMHHMLDLGLYRPAIFAARHILDLAGYDDAGTLEGPIYFNWIRFGPYYGELILPAAAEEGFNPMLVLSVVRQESLFEGFVTSFASARGLMQVIPSTGAEIATALEWPPNYSEDDLFRPVVSVRFGTYYLGEQRELFEGDLVAALAAYNAGPGNAYAWKQLAPNDPDLFLEVIRFDEPQLYIQRIYEIYEIYQDLYVTAEDPSP